MRLFFWLLLLSQDVISIPHELLASNLLAENTRWQLIIKYVHLFFFYFMATQWHFFFGLFIPFAWIAVGTQYLNYVHKSYPKKITISCNKVLFPIIDLCLLGFNFWVYKFRFSCFTLSLPFIIFFMNKFLFSTLKLRF